MTVTDGGGAGSFGAAVFCRCVDGGAIPSDRGGASFCDHAIDATIAIASAASANQSPARIWPPEIPQLRERELACDARPVIASARSTPEFDRASASPPATHLRRGGEPEGRRSMDLAADRATPLR